MKSVLLSINPKYCELIASGKKTVDIRKNRPKIDVPFKVYIYMTKKFYRQGDGYFQGKYCGKVIGEFVCDKITFLGNITTDKWKYLAGDAHEYHKKMVTEYACLSEAEVLKYGNGKSCYAWHISDLVIYDKPKEIDWFRKPIECHRGKQREHCNGCWDCEITRPPQSWCYVEEV